MAKTPTVRSWSSWRPMYVTGAVEVSGGGSGGDSPLGDNRPFGVWLRRRNCKLKERILSLCFLYERIIHLDQIYLPTKCPITIILVQLFNIALTQFEQRKYITYAMHLWKMLQIDNHCLPTVWFIKDDIVLLRTLCLRSALTAYPTLNQSWYPMISVFFRRFFGNYKQILAQILS